MRKSLKVYSDSVSDAVSRLFRERAESDQFFYPSVEEVDFAGKYNEVADALKRKGMIVAPIYSVRHSDVKSSDTSPSNFSKP